MSTDLVGIAGAGRTRVGKTPGVSSLLLHAAAAKAALEDAGLDIRDVDGIVTLGSFTDDYVMHSATIAEFLGCRSITYAEVVRVGGAAAVAAVARAVSAVERGLCRNVLVVAGDNQLSGLTRDLAVKGMAENRHAQFEAPYGITTPAAFALLANRYLHRHGLDPSLLAHVTVESRRTASKLPDAMYSEPCTVEDVNQSKPIADPLRMLHCAPIADGGGALVVRRGPSSELVRLLGYGEAHTNAHVAFNFALPDGTGGAARSIGRAFQEAGLRRADLAAAQVYDCFASVVAQILEEGGLAPEGRSLQRFADGHFAADGALPLNLHGGLLSGGHPGIPGGLFHVVEAVEQLRGSARLPVPGDGPILVHGMGGILSNHATAILGRPS